MPCATIADAMLSATSTNGERHPACATSYFIVGTREFFGDRVPMVRILQKETTLLSMKRVLFLLKLKSLKKNFDFNFRGQYVYLFSIVASFATYIYSVSQDKRKMYEASRSSWTGSVVATMRCPFVASRVADPTINIMRQKT